MTLWTGKSDFTGFYLKVYVYAVFLWVASLVTGFPVFLHRTDMILVKKPILPGFS
jgi:hypothetical protein